MNETTPLWLSVLATRRMYRPFHSIAQNKFYRFFFFFFSFFFYYFYNWIQHLAKLKRTMRLTLHTIWMPSFFDTKKKKRIHCLFFSNINTPNKWTESTAVRQSLEFTDNACMHAAMHAMFKYARACKGLNQHPRHPQFVQRMMTPKPLSDEFRVRLSRDPARFWTPELFPASIELEENMPVGTISKHKNFFRTSHRKPTGSSSWGLSRTISELHEVLIAESMPAKK